MIKITPSLQTVFVSKSYISTLKNLFTTTNIFWHAGTENYCIPVPLADISDVKREFTTRPRAAGCSAEMEEVCRDLMTAYNKPMPSSVQDGIELFNWFCAKLQ